MYQLEKMPLIGFFAQYLETEFRDLRLVLNRWVTRSDRWVTRSDPSVQEVNLIIFD